MRHNEMTEAIHKLLQLGKQATKRPWKEVAESGEWWVCGPDADHVIFYTNELSQVDVDFAIHAANMAEPLALRVQELEAEHHENLRLVGKALAAVAQTMVREDTAAAMEEPYPSVHYGNTLNQYIEAIGYLIALVPGLKIDIYHPMEMARQIFRAARLKQEDPFLPDWSKVPPWVEYRTVDSDGTITWWSSAGIVIGADAWYHDPDTMGEYLMEPEVSFNLDGLDWRNSLRARPQ